MAIRSSTSRLGKLIKTFKVFIFLAVFASQVNGLTARTLEESSDQGAKCTTCIQSSPPPPPPPSPPPPCPPPPCPPPPCPPLPELPKPPPLPPTQYCTPPPSFIYITGPPGSLYPIDSYFSGGVKASAASLPISIISGLLLLLVFFW